MKQYNKNKCTVGDFARLFGVLKEDVEDWWGGRIVPPLAALMLMEHWSTITPLLNDVVPKRKQLRDLHDYDTKVIHDDGREQRYRDRLIKSRYRKCKKTKRPVTIMEEFYQTHYYSSTQLAKMFGTGTSQVERWRHGYSPLPQHVTDFITTNDDNRLTDEHLALLKVAKGIEPISFI